MALEADEVLACFDACDEDGDGHVSLLDLKRVFADDEAFPEATLDQVCRSCRTRTWVLMLNTHVCRRHSEQHRNHSNRAPFLVIIGPGPASSSVLRSGLMPTGHTVAVSRVCMVWLRRGVAHYPSTRGTILPGLFLARLTHLACLPTS